MPHSRPRAIRRRRGSRPPSLAIRVSPLAEPRTPVAGHTYAADHAPEAVVVVAEPVAAARLARVARPAEHRSAVEEQRQPVPREPARPPRTSGIDPARAEPRLRMSDKSM